MRLRSSPATRLAPLVGLAVPAVLLLLLCGCARRGPCPTEMAPVPGLKACIDRYEASLGPGEQGEANGRGLKAVALLAALESSYGTHSGDRQSRRGTCPRCCR